MISLLAAIALSPQFVHEPTSSYEQLKMHGFTVFVSKAARAKPEDTEPALSLLQEELAEVVRLVPKKALATLRTIPFFVEYNNPDFPCACYHVSRDWLRDNGYNVAKVRSVEIANPKNFVAWVKLNQPLMVLHELAHGYHDIKFGYSDRYIAAVYKQGVLLGHYESVAHNRGGTRRHYALNNPMEFFAEATEAYFGENDFYPFNRDQLRTHHLQALEMIERCWEVR
jgi:hypothetical protein